MKNKDRRLEIYLVIIKKYYLKWKKLSCLSLVVFSFEFKTYFFKNNTMLGSYDVP